MTVTQVWQDSDLYFLILVIFIGTALAMLVASVYRYKSVNQADPRLALLWGYVPDVITEIDYEGKILTVNRAVNGFIEADVIGHSIFEFLSPEGKNIFSKSLQDAIDKKEPQRYELELNNAEKNP